MGQCHDQPRTNLAGGLTRPYCLAILAVLLVSGNPGPSRHIIGTGDFNHDGFSDILWQNDDGSVAIWEICGTNIIESSILANPGATWHV